IADKAIDEYRPIKVICVGAGFSGVCAAIRFPQRIANLSLTVYEKNPDLGGTWFENRYPGVACDIPSAAYQYTFESWSQWSELYSSGQEIQQYLKRVADKYNVNRYIKLQHRVTEARWDETKSQWFVRVQNDGKGEEVEDHCDFLVVGTGILNNWKWPEIPGLHDFKGKLLHSADWDSDFNVEGKRVALIGGGSSGIQILPALQPIANKIDHYHHSKMWIASGGFAAEEAFKRNPTGGNSKYSEEELKGFKDDPKMYHRYRAYVESQLNVVHTVTWADSDLAKTSEKLFREDMKRKLASKPEVFESMDPTYPPVCRRITPGPGYLEAICEPNVEFINTPIRAVNSNGIETNDGKQRDVDLIITATGFDTSYLPRFPVIGRDGVSLETVWEDPFPEAYMSVFADHMPNYLIFLGPNGAPPSGSTILAIESQCDYMIKCIQKCQREEYRTMEVKKEPLKAFSGWIDSYMPRTVYSKGCKSWFKRGTDTGRVVALYPGSANAFRKMLLYPRWEDFTFSRTEITSKNVFGYLGIAMTSGEMDKSQPTPYLDSIDVP
ncbi:putative flavin-binding monooxygenase, partial [Lophiostoma macrostomum CBS 122681]